MADGKYNLKNPSVKRILKEVEEMQSNPSDDFMSLPLEEDIFDWQFAIRGPEDSEFAGGIYHGRILLPAEYPFKPPSFVLLTPNGRFETHTKICLSISNHHPEHWQPSWGVRTALIALIAFMPTEPNGALGSLEYKKEDRRALALKSSESPPVFGSPDRQKLINAIHAHMKNGSVRPPNQTTGEAPAVAADGRTQHVDGDREPGSGSVVSQRSREVQTTVQVIDNRLFTWAAVGLTVAILLLLLKKFAMTDALGPLFMDRS